MFRSILFLNSVSIFNTNDLNSLSGELFISVLFIYLFIYLIFIIYFFRAFSLLFQLRVVPLLFILLNFLCLYEFR